MATRVYKYGLLPPTVNAELVREQMKLAHKFRNQLIEIERARRGAIRSILPHGQEEEAYAIAKEAFAQAAKAISEARRLTRTRAETLGMKQTKAAALEKMKAAKNTLNDARRVRKDPRILEAVAAVNTRANELMKAIRAECAVYWGTYNLVHDAMKASIEDMPLFVKGGVEPNDPHFVPKDLASNRLGVQLQRPDDQTLDRLFSGTSTLVQVGNVPEKAHLNETSRGERRRLCRTMFRMRVSSDEKQKPIFADWPMIFHRPLPKECLIKKVIVLVKKYGHREEWTAHFTVETPDTLPLRTERGQSGTVYIDVGWRQIGDFGELRVATYIDDEGVTGEFRMPARTISGLRKPEELRSIRDKELNKAKAVLLEAIKGGLPRPDWLVERTKFLHLWKSAAGLTRLAYTWRDNRFEGDVAAYDALEAWRYHDFHLFDWEANQRRSAVRRRREEYRIFAAGLARKYKTLVLEDFNMKKVAMKAPQEAEPENETARSNRVLAAISVLRDVLVNAFAEDVHKENAVDTTHICHVCGSVEDFDAAKTIHHTCGACGTTWDQDRNACVVIRARHQASLTAGRGNSSNKKSSQEKESKWDRVKREKQERLRMLQGAEESVT